MKSLCVKLKAQQFKMETATSSGVGKYETAAARWAGVGPYYAMFPVSFADYVVDTFTKPGDHVFDPFSGRATSIFSAASKARFATGIEINPVGWIYGQVKLSPAPEEQVCLRLRELSLARDVDIEREVQALPEFFSLLLLSRSFTVSRYSKNHIRLATQ